MSNSFFENGKRNNDVETSDIMNGNEGERKLNRRRKKAKAGLGSYIDINLLFYVYTLIVFGLIMVYSTTAYKSGSEDFKSQLLAVGFGTVGMIIITFIDYKRIPYLFVIVLVACLLSVVLLLTPFSVTLNNATRWFKVGPLTVQSAEIVKITMIVMMAMILSGRMGAFRNMFENWKRILFLFAFPGIISYVLYRISNNLSSFIIIMGICVCMIFVASPHYIHYIVLGIIAALCIAGLILYVKTADLTPDSDNFRKNRVVVWAHPEYEFEKDENFQTVQSLYAIGSGGLKGKGIGEGIQKINKIPEASNDMIYSVLCEELGFFGAFIVIIIYIFLVVRLGILAQNTGNFYDSMIITGVLAHIAIQAILNIAVVTNLIPNTGVSLPFISAGGSSVMFLMFEIGLVMNSSRHNKYVRQ